MITKVKCPTCGKTIEWRPENRFRPFCSERCKQIDLGAWATEQYSIPANAPDKIPEDTPGDQAGNRFN